MRLPLIQPGNIAVSYMNYYLCRNKYLQRQLFEGL